MDEVCRLPPPDHKLPSKVLSAFTHAANRLATRIKDTRRANGTPDFGLARLLLVMPKLCLTPAKPKRWVKRTIAMLQTFPDVRPSYVAQLVQVATKPLTARRQTTSDVARARACARVTTTTGSLAKGVKAFLSQGLEVVDEATMTKLRQLHPQPEVNSYPPTTRGGQATVTYTAKEPDVERKLVKLDQATAPGFDGWSAKLLVAAAQVVVPECRPAGVPIPKFSPLLSYLTRLVNWTGRNANVEREWLLAARLLPFAKDTPGEVRPVAVGTLFSRLCRQVGMQMLNLEEAVLPNQFGVGVGADVLVHRIRARLESGLANVVMALDAKNAFNLLERAAAAREVRVKTPGLRYLVDFCYGTPSQLLVVCDTGEVQHISSAQGVQQGCSLGSLLMSLVVASRTRELLEEVPELDVDSYVDDIIGLARLQDTSQVNVDDLLARVLAITARQSWKDDGIFINAVKTVVRTAEQLTTEPLKVAGAWVGGGAAISQLMCERLEEILPPFSRVRHLSKQLALATVRYCCVPLIQHWLRAHPPEVTKAAAERFDRWILRMLAGIADLSVLSPTAIAISGLPLREGGLGCLPQLAVAPLAFAASHVAAIGSIIRRAERRTEMFQDAHNATVPDTHLIDWLRAKAPASVALVSKVMELGPRDVWEKPISGAGTQRQLCTAWGKDKGIEVLLSLPTAALQIRLLDQASGIGKGWLLVIPTSDHRVKLSDADVRLALRMRLQCGMYPDYSPLDSRQCVCPNPTLDWSPEHALACMHGSARAARNLRHNYVKHLLADRMRSAALHPVVEEALPEPGSQRRRPMAMDIVVDGLDGSGVSYIDVSVVSPLSSGASHAQRGRGAISAVELVEHTRKLKAKSKQPGARGLPAHVDPTRNAAIDLLINPGLNGAVRGKERKYEDLVRQISDNNNMATGSLTPFILSTGGTLHKTAHKVLSDLAQCLFEAKSHTAYDFSTVTSNLRTKSHFASSMFKHLSCALVRKTALFFRKTTVLHR